MFQNMAVVDKGTCNTRIFLHSPKIHSQFNARKWGIWIASSRKVNCVTQRPNLTRIGAFQNQEVDLVAVEGMSFNRSVLYNPILSGSFLDSNIGSLKVLDFGQNAAIADSQQFSLN